MMFIKVNSNWIINTDHIEFIDVEDSMIYMDNGNKVTVDEEHRDAVMSALVKINNMTIVR